MSHCEEGNASFIKGILAWVSTQNRHKQGSDSYLFSRLSFCPPVVILSRTLSKTVFLLAVLMPDLNKYVHVLVDHKVRCKCTHIQGCEHIPEFADVLAVLFTMQGFAAFAVQLFHSQAFLRLGVLRPIT